MERITPTKAGKAIMEWAFRDQLIKDIEEANTELQRLYNLQYKTNGIHTKIDFLERLLMDMEKMLKKAR